MKRLRSHIFKIWIILLICSGLVTTLVEPADAACANKDFAKWLQSLAKKTRTSDLQEKFSALKKSKADLGKLIEQASQIVSQNNEDFNLPLYAASDNIQQILLVEWNQYQTGNAAMAAIPSVETAKPLAISQQQKIFPVNTVSLHLKTARFAHRNSLQISELTFSYTCSTIIPLVSGIAIGAP